MKKVSPVKPKLLPIGSTIGIVAPSSPFDKEELEQGIKILRNMGFNVQLADGIFENKGYLAGDDSLRTAQLHQMFKDSQIDAVMCARGGFGALKLLGRIDFEIIRSYPKPFIGFSDITALHQAIWLNTAMVTLHGPTVCSLSSSDNITQDAFLKTLTSDLQLTIRAVQKRVLYPGAAQGRVLGGNLATLCHLLGTPFTGAYAGAILFIEDVGEAPYRVDRMLTQMKLAGCFKGLAGVVAGSFKKCGRDSDIYEILKVCFAQADIPVLAGFPAGHKKTNVCLPLGINASLDTNSGELRFSETVMEP
ncbi:MAG: LD-carboxypeptidase [Desulfobacteraceae bacterium]|nr:LD-carboxypeptidase [Desulfobacteraceae bacterium]